MYKANDYLIKLHSSSLNFLILFPDIMAQGYEPKS